jgi:transcriptional regulator with XRE-family HTH domain
VYRVHPELAGDTPTARLAWELGRAVRDWRLAHGLPQRVVAERLGWDQPQVARLEAGQVIPSGKTLLRVMDGLGVRITLSLEGEGLRRRPVVRLEPAEAPG